MGEEDERGMDLSKNDRPREELRGELKRKAKRWIQEVQNKVQIEPIKLKSF